MEPLSSEAQGYTCCECKLNPIFGGVILLGLKFVCDKNGSLRIYKQSIDTPNSQPMENVGRPDCKRVYDGLLKLIDKMPIDDFFQRYAK